tara:strand:+ start:2954 stop:3130 length:177 start_codon:yes stop_codon:yes gene_type:complete
MSGMTVRDIANEINEQLDAFVDDAIYECDFLEAKPEEVKKAILQIIVENIEENYENEQ